MDVASVWCTSHVSSYPEYQDVRQHREVLMIRLFPFIGGLCAALAGLWLIGAQAFACGQLRSGPARLTRDPNVALRGE